MTDARDALIAFRAAHATEGDRFNPQDFEPLGLVRAAMEDFNRGDAEAFLDQTDPDIEWWPLRSATEGAYRGHEGVRAWFEETSALFDYIRASIDAAEWRAGRLLADGELKLQGKQSGAALELPVTWVLEFKGAKVIWGRAFGDRASAIEALDERSKHLRGP